MGRGRVTSEDFLGVVHSEEQALFRWSSRAVMTGRGVAHGKPP